MKIVNQLVKAPTFCLLHPLGKTSTVSHPLGANAAGLELIALPKLLTVGAKSLIQGSVELQQRRAGRAFWRKEKA